MLLYVALGCATVHAAIVINELNYNPPGAGDATEFIEFHNDGTNAVNLDGWSMSDGVDYVFPADAWIAPGGFLVLAKNPVAFSAMYPGVTNVFGPFANDTGLNNSGERVALSDADGALVCEVTYSDTTPWPTAPDGDGPTLELRHPALPLASPASWDASRVIGGTPGATNSVYAVDAIAFAVTRTPLSPAPTSAVMLLAEISMGGATGVVAHVGVEGVWQAVAFSQLGSTSWVCTLPAHPEGTWVSYFVSAVSPSGDSYVDPPTGTNLYRVLARPPGPRSVIINEIMYNSAVEAHTQKYEYVELLNVSAATVDLAGCIFEKVRLPTNQLLLAPGAFAVITDKPQVFSNVYGSVERVLGLDIGLSDGGETLRLEGPNGEPLCSVTYDDENGWPTDPDGDGPSLELRSPLLALNDAASWGSSLGFGTPGGPNSVLSNGLFATLDDATVTPARPAPFQPVHLTVHALASTAIVDVTAYYTTNQRVVAAAPMADDGLNGDGYAGDGIYGVMLPAMPDDTIVWYAFVMRLADGSVVQLPAMTNAYAPDIPAPPVVIRMSYEGLRTEVTPTSIWKFAETTGVATHSLLYIYTGGPGEVLIDDVTISDGVTQHVANSGFTTSVIGWSNTGTHASSRWDGDEGANAPGCLHIVAKAAGGSIQNSVNQNMNPPPVQDNRLYTLRFAYKAVTPPAPTGTQTWLFYRVASNVARTVCINEINYHPMHDGLGQFEYIELYNYGSQTVNLAEWTVANEDGRPFSIPADVALTPGAYVVLCRDTNAVATYYEPLAPCIGNLPFDLGNHEDEVFLRDSSGVLVDYVNYTDVAPWPVAADGQGSALERLDPRGNGSATNWQASTGAGSPGAPTSGRGMTINAIWHTPAVPLPAAAVSVGASVTNLTGSLRVFYRVNNAGAWQSAAMLPAGNNYAANIGGFAHGNYVAFYVEASNANARVRFPAAGPRQPALFECDQYRDAYTLPVFRYLFTDQSWNTLINRWTWDNTDVDGTLIIGTQVCYNVGIHLHGNYSRYVYKGYAFNAYLNYGQTYNGRRKVAYVFNWEEGARLGVPLSRYIHAQAGAPVFETRMITVKRRGVQLPLMHYVEPYDEQFITNQAMPPGTIYKATQAGRQQAFFTFGGYDKGIYDDCYEAHGSTDPDHRFQDLARALEAMYSLPEEQFIQQATQYVDYASIAQARATYHYTKMGDGWPQWGQNYAVFVGENTPLQLFNQDIGPIGWGPWRLFPTVAGVQRIMRLPETMHSFWTAMTNLLYGTATTAMELNYIEQLYRQASNDVNRYHGNATTFYNNKESLRNTISAWNSSVHASGSGWTETGNGPSGIPVWGLRWISQPNRCVLLSNSYWHRVCAYDPAQRPITYTKVTGPAWLGLNPSTGVLTGMPTAVGSYSVSIRAQTSAANITQVFSIEVQAPANRLRLKFDEGIGTIAADSSSYGNNGALQNSVTWNTDGRYGSSLCFGPGGSDQVYIPAASSLNIAGDWTFETWLKITQTSRGQAYIFRKYEELGFEMGKDATVMGGRFWFGPFDDGWTNRAGLGGHGYVLMRYNPDPNVRLLTPNTWHHVAVTHERDRAEVYLYIDNQRVGGMVYEGNLLGTQPMYIGGSFSGLMDEVALHNFARRAFNIGLNIDAVRFAAPRAYIQVRNFNRGDVAPLNLKQFALRLEPSGRWAQLPAIKLAPGAEVRINLSDLPSLGDLPAAGGLALYPFDDKTIYPEGNYVHSCTRILDYVAWGDAAAAPDAQHPAVQAGLWQLDAVVDTDTNTTGRIMLKTPGRNDRGALSWVDGTTLQAPVLTPVAPTTTVSTVNFAWQAVPGVASYDLEWSQDPGFAVRYSTNVAVTNVVAQLDTGAWYWRARSWAGGTHSAYRNGNDFCVMVGQVLVALNVPGQAGLITNATILPILFDVYSPEPLSTVDVIVNGSVAGHTAGNYTLAVGSNSIWVSAVTTGMLAGSSSTNFYIVDLTPPTLTLTAPADGTLTNTAVVRLAWLAADDYGLGPSFVTTNAGVAWLAHVNDHPFTTSEGSNHWTARVRDLAGNWSAVPAARLLEIDTTPPALFSNILLQPFGGETYEVGQNIEIAWRSNHFTELHPTPLPIALRFSTNGGATWMEITNNLADTGWYTWLTPSAMDAATDCFVRLDVRDALGNTASASNPTPFKLLPEISGLWVISLLCALLRATARRG